MTEPEPAQEQTDDESSRGGCLWLFALLCIVGLVVWGVEAGLAAFDAWRSPDAYDALVPFRSGYLDPTAQTLGRQSASLWGRILVGVMFCVIPGGLLTAALGGAARGISEAASEKVIGVGVGIVFLVAFVYIPVAAVLLPLYPVVVDPERQVFEMRERTFYGPFNGWSSRVERTVPFARVRRIGHRVSHETERGGHYTSAEVLALVDAEPKPEWVLLGVAQVESGELDFVSCVRSSESIDQEAFDLGLAAAEALTLIAGVESPPLSEEQKKEPPQ